MRVIVTRPASEAQGWTRELRSRGFDVLALPLIEIGPGPRPVELLAAWQQLASFHAAMFVSANAVRHFFAARPAGAQWAPATRAWATGPGTHQALADAGVAASSIDSPPAQAAQFDSEALWDTVSHQIAAVHRVLIVRGSDDGREAGGRDWLAERVRAAGARVDTVVSYSRAAPHWRPEQLSEARQAVGAGGVWLFSSSQAIANLRGLLPRQDWAAARAVATHPRIASAARQAGFGVVCESRPSLDAIAAALESFR